MLARAFAQIISWIIPKARKKSRRERRNTKIARHKFINSSISHYVIRESNSRSPTHSSVCTRLISSESSKKRRNAAVNAELQNDNVFAKFHHFPLPIFIFSFRIHSRHCAGGIQYRWWKVFRQSMIAEGKLALIYPIFFVSLLLSLKKLS